MKNFKLFIFIVVIVLVMLNWDRVSWLFNYREMGGLVYDFFNPYPESKYLVSASEIRLPATNPAMQNQPVQLAEPSQPVQPQTQPTPSQNPTPQPTTTQTHPYSPEENSLFIPALNLSTAVVIGQSTNIKSLEKDLNSGAVVYPGSVAPGQIGQMIVLGHSAPPGWPHIKHDWVFTDISKLNVGDSVILTFNNHQYTYRIIDKNIIKKGQDVGTMGLNGHNNVLTMVSCWPPGKDYQRIAVSAELVN